MDRIIYLSGVCWVVFRNSPAGLYIKKHHPKLGGVFIQYQCLLQVKST
jgi:hypothetical protein